MESLLAGHPTSRPNDRLPKHTVATWCRTGPQRVTVGYTRLRTGVGRFNHNMKRWGLRPSAACTCGHPDQTAHHVIHDCPTLSPPDTTTIDLTNPNPDTVNWLRRPKQTAYLTHTQEEEDPTNLECIMSLCRSLVNMTNVLNIHDPLRSTF